LMSIAACTPSSNASGSGGSTGSGGSSGTGGIGNPNCINSPDDLIADFTMDNGLHQVDGRVGGFYTYDDMTTTGVLTPPDGGPDPIDTSTGNTCSGPGSFHVTATGFTTWGAATGTDFVAQISTPMGMKKGTYDASRYSGVSFWAKATAPLTGVQVSFPDVWTDGNAWPTAVDSTVDPCVYLAGSTTNCSPYLVKLGSPDYPAYMNTQIDTGWKRFDIKFADTTQDKDNGPGGVAGMGLQQKPGIDLQHLTAMAVQVNAIHNADSSITANNFEIWLDDINFTK
jgi:hypothetical protein